MIRVALFAIVKYTFATDRTVENSDAAEHVCTIAVAVSIIADSVCINADSVCINAVSVCIKTVL
jgi:hypothetical protein